MTPPPTTTTRARSGELRQPRQHSGRRVNPDSSAVCCDFAHAGVADESRVLIGSPGSGPAAYPGQRYDERKERTTSPSRPSWRETAGWDLDDTGPARRRRRVGLRLRRRAGPRGRRGAHRRHAGPGRAPRAPPGRRPVAPSSRTSARSSTASSAWSGWCSSGSGPRAPSRTPRTPWPSSRCSPRPPAPRCSTTSTSGAASPTPRRTSDAARSTASGRSCRPPAPTP